jgi:hypothetical protein
MELVEGILGVKPLSGTTRAPQEGGLMYVQEPSLVKGILPILKFHDPTYFIAFGAMSGCTDSAEIHRLSSPVSMSHSPDIRCCALGGLLVTRRTHYPAMT